MLGLNKKYEKIVAQGCEVFSQRALAYIAILIYKAILDYIYCCYIGGGGHSFFSVQISFINVINGWLLVVIMAPAIIYYYRQKTCSAILMAALNMIYFIPITTYCGYGGGSSSFLFWTIVYWAILSILQIKIPFIRWKRRGNIDLDKVFYVATLMISVCEIYIWIKYTDCRILTNLTDVYVIRAEAAKYAVPQLLKYIHGMAHIFIAMLMVLAMHKKKYITLVWLLFLILINFSYAGVKSVIFFPILLIGGYIFYRRDMICLAFPLGVIIQLVAIVEQLIGSMWITSLFFRRQSLVLAQLSENYYRFFIENPIDLFRNGIIGRFGFDSGYSQNISKVIGNNFATQTVGCNNGLLADVWAHLGLIGLVVMPIILIVCFRLLDFVSHGVDPRLTVGLTLYYALTFANSSWSTVLLTHGYLLMCIGLLIFPREKAVVKGKTNERN